MHKNRFTQISGTVAGITVILNGLELPIKCWIMAKNMWI